MTLFKNKYRIESARLKGYDYSSPGEYFVTICTKGMVEWFGEVVDGIMKRNDIGEFAHQMWMDIPTHHENITMDEYIIMPNHVHGIIVLLEDRHVSIGEKTKFIIQSRDVACSVSTSITAKISPKHGSLGAIIRSYKSAVSNWCHTNGHDVFAWQPRFHDHIIRDEKDLNNTREYIVNNPLKWVSDEENLLIKNSKPKGSPATPAKQEAGKKTPDKSVRVKKFSKEFCEK